jgi:2-C-methyl-D-erythritol 2,4-cyclodiphosphate synthase
MLRIGLGFDNHRLVAGRPLWIGGVEIPSPVGEEAHSDGDVLLHALTDAILGAAGAGDIGEHFPDSDPRWKDQPSSLFLHEAARIASGRGFRLVNLDATVFLEEVKLSKHKQAIRGRLRELLAEFWDLDPDAVSVKAKTAERCDAVGTGEAVAAQVVVLLESR